MSNGELVDEPVPYLFDSGWQPFEDHSNVWSYFEPDVSGMRDPLHVWRTQRSVRTVVGFLARNFAQVQMHAFTRDDAGDRRRLAIDHPLERSLRYPDDTETPFEFAQTMIVDLSLWDRWAALKIVQPDDSVRLRRLPPRRWRYVRDGEDAPTAVRVFRPVEDGSNSPQFQDLPLDRFVWLDGYPVPEGAHSPMEYLTELLVEERESGRARVAMWRNGARINGWIERPLEAPPWSTTARDNFRKGFVANYGRNGSRESGTPILEDGMKLHDGKVITPVDAQQVEARKLTMAEVAAAFYVAPVLVGVLDNANYSNVQAYREILYSDTLGPLFAQVSQAMNARLVPDIDPTRTSYVEHNVDEKLRMSFEEQAKVLQSAVGGPWMLRSEARQRANLPRIDGADELIVPLNVLVGGQASPTDSAPEGE